MSGGGLCATALKMVYGREDVEASGPVVTGFKVKGCKVQVSFKLAEGLTTTDNAAGLPTAPYPASDLKCPRDDTAR